jgi:hypothetical protein
MARLTCSFAAEPDARGEAYLPEPRAAPAVASIRGRTRKLPQDTVQGCHDRAAADLQQSVAVITANQRLRLEKSAASWTSRANLLDRLQKRFEQRRAMDRISDQDETDHVRIADGQLGAAS